MKAEILKEHQALIDILKDAGYGMTTEEVAARMLAKGYLKDLSESERVGTTKEALFILKGDDDTIFYERLDGELRWYPVVKAWSIEEFSSVIRITVAGRKDVIEIYKPTKSCGELQAAKINWAALGSVSTDYAHHFAKALQFAITKTKELNGESNKLEGYLASIGNEHELNFTIAEIADRLRKVYEVNHGERRFCRYITEPLYSFTPSQAKHIFNLVRP